VDGEPRRSNTGWLPRLKKIPEIQAKVRRLHLENRQAVFN
jgi:hypothetical protein